MGLKIESVKSGWIFGDISEFWRRWKFREVFFRFFAILALCGGHTGRAIEGRGGGSKMPSTWLISSVLHNVTAA